MTQTAATCPFDHRASEVAGMGKYEIYAGLRERRVQRSDVHGGFWILTHAADVEAALLDTEVFSSQRGGVHLPPSPTEVPLAGLEHDPPEHTPYRRLFAKAVGRPAMNAARCAAAGGGDFVAEVSAVLPVEAIAAVIGLPQAKATLLRELTEYTWTHLHSDPKCFDPLIAMYMGEIEARRVEPRDDFLSHIANLETLGDRPMTDLDLQSVVNGLLLAGHETTMNASANLALYLARDPALRARIVADPSVVPAVVEESLRFDAPVQGFFRMLTRDVEIDGTVLREGDFVLLSYGSANRDPAAFADPTAFDPDRENLKHYAFGWGVHRCIGAMLSQLELRILVELLAPYDFSVVGEPVYGPPSAGGTFSGLTSLQLALPR